MRCSRRRCRPASRASFRSSCGSPSSPPGESWPTTCNRAGGPQRSSRWRGAPVPIVRNSTGPAAAAEAFYTEEMVLTTFSSGRYRASRSGGAGPLMFQRSRKFSTILAAVALVGVAASGVAGQGRGGAQGGRGGTPAPPLTGRAAARIDLTGYWVALVTEDWRHRMYTPPKGDYDSVPLG